VAPTGPAPITQAVTSSVEACVMSRKVAPAAGFGKG
jgi:hypothetical protein